ncbi:MAG: glycosyltransferase family 4 protein [Desulfobacteraceae bacterium]|nr:glycosyltransferase family 4 protein [Desulfobacteraceae bacterium]
MKEYKTIIFYDVTRLISRRSSPIASGIDRVDIKYLRYVLNKYGTACNFITKIGSQAIPVNRQLAVKLIETLEKTWFGSKDRDLDVARDIEMAGLSKTIKGFQGPFGGRVKNLSVRLLWKHFKKIIFLNDVKEIKKTLPNKVQCFIRLPNIIIRTIAFFYAFLSLVISIQWLGILHFYLFNKRWFQQKKLDRYMKKNENIQKVYIVCSHHGIARNDSLLTAICKKYNLHVIAYIHDLIPVEYPEYVRPNGTNQFKNYLSNLAQVNANFIANSYDTAQRLMTYAQKNEWQIDTVPFTYPPYNPKLIKKRILKNPKEQSLNNKHPYFITISTIEPRKNHLLLLHIWRNFVCSELSSIPHLHIIGKRGWENENIIDMLSRCTAIQPYITEHNNLPDNQVLNLLYGARALLFPTFAEGYGLPLIEALSHGIPVIASNLAIFREIAHDIPEYIDPLDGKKWKNMIINYSQKNSIIREKQLKRIQYRNRYATEAPSSECFADLISQIINRKAYKNEIQCYD